MHMFLEEEDIDINKNTPPHKASVVLSNLLTLQSHCL